MKWLILFIPLSLLAQDISYFNQQLLRKTSAQQDRVAIGVSAYTNGTMSLLSVTNGMFIDSNSLALWPTKPAYQGQAFLANSNGVIYLLTSTSTNWTATNKLAP